MEIPHQIEIPADDITADQIRSAAHASREGRITRLGDVIGWDTVRDMKAAKSAARRVAQQRIGLPLSEAALDYINRRSGRVPE